MFVYLYIAVDACDWNFELYEIWYNFISWMQMCSYLVIALLVWPNKLKQNVAMWSADRLFVLTGKWDILTW